MSQYIHPCNLVCSFLEDDFFKKLPLYKTAWSPLHGEYVSIKNVRYDSDKRPILDCTIGSLNGQIHLFRVEELTNYVI